MKRAVVRSDSYFDSIYLMAMSKDLREQRGITDAVVAMGTAMNVELLRAHGYREDELAEATPNDLILAVECDDAAGIEAAIATATERLTKRGAEARESGTAFEPASLEAAIAALPGANLAVVSVPGPYAAREARKALRLGLHVMLFSDNVSLEEEVALKELGRSKGLLVMGPDCGTAIINGVPICFANAVRRGPVGIVAASGTGLQEVSCLVDRYGSGVSEGIGTGGRDLRNWRVGGITTLMGIEALASDAATSVLVVLSKPPARDVARTVLDALGSCGKPAVVYFIGLDPAESGVAAPNVHFVASLEEAAARAVGLANGKPVGDADRGPDERSLAAIADREAERLARSQRFLRGYFTGGTLADEALVYLHGATGAVYSNDHTDGAYLLKDPRMSVGHTIVDLGDDVFTVGRPHPMIDPSTRTERISAEIGDPSVAVMLVDVVLGWGSCSDPAGALVPALVEARSATESRGGYLPVVASVVGTAGDPQGRAGQVAQLEAAGCVVMPSNYRAAVLTAKILERAARRGAAT